MGVAERDFEAISGRTGLPISLCLLDDVHVTYMGGDPFQRLSDSVLRKVSAQHGVHCFECHDLCPAAFQLELGGSPNCSRDPSGCCLHAHKQPVRPGRAPQPLECVCLHFSFLCACLTEAKEDVSGEQTATLVELKRSPDRISNLRYTRRCMRRDTIIFVT